MEQRTASYVWRLAITLRDVEPVVWRTILVRPDTKLAMLHRYVQAAMGWRDYHLFSFTIAGREYGIPHPELDRTTRTYDARRYTLSRLFPSPPATFRYVYDFGNHWEHDIAIEGVEPAAYRKQYPICVDGSGPCPPEDCGGPAGYERLRTILGNQGHPEHAEMSAWASSQYYRDDFWAQTATWAMRDVQRGYR